MNTIHRFGILTVLALLAVMINPDNICVLNGVKGSWATANGIGCEFVECKPKRGHDRGLKLFRCEKKEGKKRIKLNKFCIYFGEDPHNPSCSNTYHRNETKYYESLAKSAMENDAPCAKPTISDDLNGCNLKYPCIHGDCPEPPATGSDQYITSVCF